MENVIIDLNDNDVFTSGLRKITGYEFRVSIQNRTVAEYTRLLNYLIAYLADGKPIIKDGQTIAFHSWLFESSQSG